MNEVNKENKEVLEIKKGTVLEEIDLRIRLTLSEADKGPISQVALADLHRLITIVAVSIGRIPNMSQKIKNDAADVVKELGDVCTAGETISQEDNVLVSYDLIDRMYLLLKTFGKRTLCGDLKEVTVCEVAISINSKLEKAYEHSRIQQESSVSVPDSAE